ncbi:MAG: ATP-binding protein [Muribaculaceae bacterium]|nr:ATP-binding protein [Muribaculaceae bacterium]
MNQTVDDIFSVKDFGPIKNANVSLGDLTILIGPQASGKSLFLELFKLVKDHDHIVSTLEKYNYVLGEATTHSLAEYYFGEGLSSLINDSTEVISNDENVTEKLIDVTINDNEPSRESVFYVPAQRILSIADGRPKNFMEFDLSTPYPLRFFSETLRVFMQGEFTSPDVIFPMKLRLDNRVKESINSSIFHNGKVVLDQSGGQRKMKLSIGGMKLPFMTWSAGQKEFMPLLLAIYCLTGLASSVVKRDNYKWVIIEEPEMGLHPKAIESVIIEVIELLLQGYKVILSTHSSIFIDFAWTLQLLSGLSHQDFKKAMCQLFNLPLDSRSKSIFNDLQSKDVKVFYFDTKDSEGVVSTDISSLNVMDCDKVVSEWGGLSSFASRASEIVSEYGQA